MNKIRYPLILVTIFSIAMGYMESAIVIYLREILYPEGFAFPLKVMPADLSITEFLREAATLVMLLTVGIMAGKTFSQRFAWFIYAFAIWDIFFYGFLKLLINWPESFMTWDLLFLIPVIWTGPVITPVIVSFTMILLAMAILYFSGKDLNPRIILYEWILLIIGALAVFTSFIWDFSKYISRYTGFSDLFTMYQDPSITQVLMSYSPAKFNWGFFIPGEIILLTAIILYYMRLRRKGNIQLPTPNPS